MATQAESQQANTSYERRREAIQFFVEALDENLTLEMVQIPAGKFTMGSPETELERLDREGPQHDVQIEQFFMGQYPVTQAQWQFVAGVEQVERTLEANPSNFKGENHPVEQVSWYEAVEFCQRLSTHTGRNYGLPTEAEWEYACRTGTTTPFHFGNTITTEVANYNGSSYAGGPAGEPLKRTTPVDHFGIANAFGLCDMHGNVWEWCQDLWHKSYDHKITPSQDGVNLQQEQADHRVVRGGSWYSSPGKCRSASRFHFRPTTCESDLGFRVICKRP
ncbi:formylglycine-generating enzyme family protein [Leptothoe spongobia]|uniref:Formylglycine-generating enzyme family protein n=1 Tax=Leptothoe spongobia TAU-MAC 1115 TaxID=1967444 RepID=A0A947GKJ4_9CYAN|nr:formylglycine-generating enzyme family protein [Leptothoe spongobia]MBT9317484.1 formylglycine-generating enzyme family protein [Leptothoe spongobia TAU-MAC 1115]